MRLVVVRIIISITYYILEIRSVSLNQLISIVKIDTTYLHVCIRMCLCVSIYLFVSLSLHVCLYAQ